MIPLHTPPGTPVVYHPVERNDHPSLPELKEGHVYALAEIVECTAGAQVGTFAVRLEETRQAHETIVYTLLGPMYFFYNIANFELAVLPKCLTEILERAPDPELVKEERTLAVKDYLRHLAEEIAMQLRSRGWPSPRTSLPSSAWRTLQGRPPTTWYLRYRKD